MSKPVKNRILELFQSGLSCIEISKQLRCAKSTVSYHCSKLLNKNDKFSEEKVVNYQKYYDKGFSLKQTAKNFDISPQALSKRLVLRKLTSLQIKQRQSERHYIYRIETKKKCVEYKGGKCCKCGYDKCMSALDFHHIDSSKKDFTISGGTKSFENLKKELDKCILVCRNCHSEIHAGLITVT